MSSIEELSFVNGWGKTITRQINHHINLKDYEGTPGYSLLMVAANTHLSLEDIELFLDRKSDEVPNVERSRSWIQRRRWLFQKPGTDNTKPPVADRDGKQARAVAIMREHPKESAKHLVYLLKQNGIRRSKEWVRQHRCDAVGNLTAHK